MKKIIIVLLFAIFIFTGCKNKDFSKYPFTETSWSRNNGHDIETINFKTNGSFSYTCACGNPVNDADLCENYTYNEDTKEIKLKTLYFFIFISPLFIFFKFSYFTTEV